MLCVFFAIYKFLFNDQRKEAKKGAKMWKSMGYNVSSAIAKTMAENANDPDEWDTDPDFVVR